MLSNSPARSLGAAIDQRGSGSAAWISVFPQQRWPRALTCCRRRASRRCQVNLVRPVELDELLPLAQLHHVVRRVEARPQHDSRIDLRAGADDAAGVQHAVAAGEDAVAEDGAELAAAGGDAGAASFPLG